MKKSLFLFIPLILSFTACNDAINEPKFPVKYQKEIQDDIAEVKIYEELQKNYPNDFDNIVTFKSFQELYDELDSLNNYDYKQLRLWTLQMNHTNDVFESNIVVDSLLSLYTNDGETFNDEICHKLLYVAHNQYSNLIPQLEQKKIFAPIGEIGVKDLLNDRGLLVVFPYILMQTDYGIDYCLLSDYKDVRNEKRKHEVLMSYGDIDWGNITYSQIPLADTITKFHPYMVTYKYSVDYHYSPFYKTSDINVKVTVKNYKYAIGIKWPIKRQIAIDTDFEVEYFTYPIELVSNFAQHKYNWVTVRRVYQYSFNTHSYYCEKVPYYGSNIKIRKLLIDNGEVYYRY